MSPDAVEPMVQPSLLTLVVFVGLVMAIVSGFVAAIRWSGVARGDASVTVQRDVRRAVVASAAYLALTAGAAASGLLRQGGTPPPIMPFLGLTNVVAIAIAFSRVGTRLARHVPIAALVGFQVFRLPLELVLHQWYAEGVLPVTMTYAGRNFDILSGILAIPVALWAWKGTPPRWVVAAYTLVGLGLLLRVISLAVLSSPLPFRQYFEGPPVQLAGYAPTVWIVPICVAGALCGHLIVLRWLRMQRD